MRNSLPIEDLRESLISSCARTRRIVLRAPTGSGKSTQLPQMLLDLGLVQGQIVVLQPRRMAARLLAQRVAQERKVTLGEEVGYQIRFERVESEQTRIKFVTEALLLRQMTSASELKGVGAVIFDEFHERSLHSDVALALAKQIQKTSRPDLLIVVMSATLDTDSVAEWLGEAETLVADGRTFPVEIAYHPVLPSRAREIPEIAAEQVEKILTQENAGDVLVFMPGAYEISRTISALKNSPVVRGTDIFPLHGELSTSDQDLAVKSSERRKIIVATNVAETSLTIPNVRFVVDSGLARVARFDPHRGINSLLIESISQASAEQRAGRAGRTGPGHCLRLWSHTHHQSRPLRETPEIKRVDLAESLLFILSAGWSETKNFPWFEKPEEANVQRALSLLHDLGALDHEGRITSLGQRMARFPTHPRYSRLLMAGHDYDCVPAVALMAGLAQGRDLLLRKVDEYTEQARAAVNWEAGSDFFFRLALWQKAKEVNFDGEVCRRLGVHAQAAREAGKAAQQLIQIAEGQGLRTMAQGFSNEALRRCLLLGFSDRLALRADAGTLRCHLVHGRRGELRRESMVRSAKLFVAADVDEIQTRGEVTTFLSLITAIEESWLKEFFPDDFSEKVILRFDSTQRRVVQRTERRFRDIVLEAVERPAEPSEASGQILAEEVMAGRLLLERWDGGVDRWIHRVNFLAKHCPECAISPFDEEGRRLVIEQVCAGAVTYKEIKDRPVLPIIRGWLNEAQALTLDDYCPEKLVLPRKKTPVSIEYTPDGEAFIEATVQELYDVSGVKLRVCQRKIPLVVCIQSPARRTQQKTTDLDAFWKGSYEQVKKDLKGRYPKHEWR